MLQALNVLLDVLALILVLQAEGLVFHDLLLLGRISFRLLFRGRVSLGRHDGADPGSTESLLSAGLSCSVFFFFFFFFFLLLLLPYVSASSSSSDSEVTKIESLSNIINKRHKYVCIYVYLLSTVLIYSLFLYVFFFIYFINIIDIMY